MSIYNEIFKRECETKFGTFVKYFIFSKKMTEESNHIKCI